MIPDSVEIIEPHAFYGCCMTYLCQASSKPEGWMNDLSNSSVIWDFKNIIDDATFIYAINESDQASILGLSPQCTQYYVLIPTMIDNYEIISFTFRRHPFAYGQHVKSVAISDGITSIPERAFDGCSLLSNIAIPQSVTKIGVEAFRSCESLKSVTLPSGLVKIDSSTFIGCVALQSITIPDSVTSIGDRAFYSCISLGSIIIPSGVVSMGSYVFYDCSKLSIFCRLKVCPSGWASDWNPENRPVTWNYSII
jgi:hypothetical protein